MEDSLCISRLKEAAPVFFLVVTFKKDVLTLQELWYKIVPWAQGCSEKEIFEVLSSAKTPELHSNYLVMIDQCHIFNPAKNRTSEVFGDHFGFTTHYTNNR